MYFKPIRRELLPAAKDRFEKAYKKTNECWEWQKSLTKSGYGVFSLGNKNMVAHRISYSLYKGPIPEDSPLDHICANKKCVNPDHLEIVSFSENTTRMHNRKRSDTHCANGHAFAEVGTYERLNAGKRVKMCNKCTEISRLKYRSKNKNIKTDVLDKIEEALKAAEQAIGNDCEDGGFCPVTIKIRVALQSIASFRKGQG